MSSPRRTHIAASVAYAVLAATMAGVLLSSARVLPEFELPSLHLSSGSDAHQAPVRRTEPAPSGARTAPQPGPLRPSSRAPLAASSTRTCDATDFECLVAGAASPEPTQVGRTGGPPTVVVKFRPSQPARPGAGSPAQGPQEQAAGPAVGTSSGASAGTATAAPTTEVSPAAPTDPADPSAGTPTATPTPTASATPTDGPVDEATATPDPAGTAGGGSGPTGSAPASSPPPGP